jgi:hypothetical protein
MLSIITHCIVCGRAHQRRDPGGPLSIIKAQIIPRHTRACAVYPGSHALFRDAGSRFTIIYRGPAETFDPLKVHRLPEPYPIDPEDAQRAFVEHQKEADLARRKPLFKTFEQFLLAQNLTLGEPNEQP